MQESEAAMRNSRHSKPAHQRNHPVHPKWLAYEREKSAWEFRNPGASNAEHERAMREIEKKVGI